MLDEVFLTDLLGDLGEAVAPPRDGPAKVLARRAELTPEPRSSAPSGTAALVRRHRILSAAAVLIVLAGGLGIAVRHRAHRVTIAGLAITPHAAERSAGAPASAKSAAASADLGAPAAAPPAPAAAPSIPTRIIKTGDVILQVPKGELSSSITELTSTVAGLGGYIASTTTTEGGATPTGDLTLRVPAAEFEILLAKVRSLGTPTSVTTSGQDVTSQYVDLQARITALQDSRQRYLDILTQASSIGDILAVQQQIDGIQTQLEELQGQLNVLNDQTSYATLTVHLFEPASPPPPPVHRHPSGLATAWAHARRSFAHGAESVIGASGGVAIFLICLGLIAFAGRVAWAFARRRLV